MVAYKFIASEIGKVLHEGEFESPDEVEEVLLFLTEYFGCQVECVQVHKQDVSKPVRRLSEPEDKESFIGFIIWTVLIILMLGAGVSIIAVSVHRPIQRTIPDQRPNPTGTDLLAPEYYRR
ncbi:MAG TPA: hypothetical protein V6D14_33460 [Coleofasciculaceae cyanobacterium]|jgi:hypothetical protein